MGRGDRCRVVRKDLTAMGWRHPEGLKSKKLLRRWREQKAELLAALPLHLNQCLAKGNAEAIHELRVTLRRLRLYVRLGRPLLVRKRLKDFLRWARCVSKATSPVRDLDVALEWLQGRENTEELIELLQDRRMREWRLLVRRVATPPRGLLKGLTSLRPNCKPHARLARRYLKIESSLAHGVCRGVLRFLGMRDEQQHQFRRLVRWSRYLREIGLPRRARKDDALISVLVEMQEASGDRQNLILADMALRRLRRPVVVELRRALVAQQATISTRIRSALKAVGGFCPPET